MGSARVSASRTPAQSERVRLRFQLPPSRVRHNAYAMEFFNRIIVHYGWEGTALAGVLLVMFGIQLYYYLFVYGRIPKYKDTGVRRSSPKPLRYRW